MAGTLTITGFSASEPAGQRVLGPLTLYGTVVVGETLVVPLNAGDNTFAVPTGAVGVCVVPPTTGGVNLKVRFNTNPGDTGLPISSALPSVLSFGGTSPTAVVLNAASGQSSPISLWFW